MACPWASLGLELPQTLMPDLHEAVQCGREWLGGRDRRLARSRVAVPVATHRLSSLAPGQ